MDQMCVRMLRELQELEFALVELNLYLDTHPCDTQAIETFNDLAVRYEKARKAYENKYGPLVNFGHSGPVHSHVWQWIDEPWPWEIEY
ncbi:MAG: spore coat protein CotJB [Syntrophaceticus sp.]